MTTSTGSTLHKLRDTSETVDGTANDIRGREVTDRDGVSLGRVEDLLVDDAECRVRFLVVDHGGLLGVGRKRSFIPVDAIAQITDAAVVIAHSREHVASAPAYDPDVVDERAYQSSVSGHYGYAPYWGADYAYPYGHSTAPTSPRKTF